MRSYNPGVAWWQRRDCEQLHKTILEEIQRRNLCKFTADGYARVVEEFSLYHHRPSDQLGPEQIGQYQAHHLNFNDRKLDSNTVAQHLSSFEVFFDKTLTPRSSPNRPNQA